MKRNHARSEKRKLSRRIYRLFKSSVLSSPPGLAKPVGVHTLAQETPKAQLSQHHANTLKFKATGRSSCFHRYKATYNLKTFAKDFGKGRHHPHKDPLGKWAYNSPIRMGSLNCRGLKGEDADAQKSSLVLAMKRFKIDILLLQETHINTNSYEKINGHTFIYSTSVTDEQRKTAETRRAQAGMHKGRGKGKNAHVGRGHRQQAEDTEHGGVGCVLSPLLMAAVTDFEQVDGRIMSVTISNSGPPIYILSTCTLLKAVVT